MLTKIKIALVAVIVASTVSAALARSPSYNPEASTPSGPVMYDNGQGRYAPADAPGIG